MSYFRRPRTTQERRRGAADVADGLPVRKSRYGYNLPSARDDLWRCLQRNWKVFRKTKWKTLRPS